MPYIFGLVIKKEEIEVNASDVTCELVLFFAQEALKGLLETFTAFFERHENTLGNYEYFAADEDTICKLNVLQHFANRCSS